MTVTLEFSMRLCQSIGSINKVWRMHLFLSTYHYYQYGYTSTHMLKIPAVIFPWRSKHILVKTQHALYSALTRVLLRPKMVTGPVLSLFKTLPN